ncbi:MAG: hypothetical protein WCG95_05370 [bacterium]
MDFFKNFFNDEATIIGLCGFKTIKSKYINNPIENDFFFNPFESNRVFETNFKQNVFLEV